MILEERTYTIRTGLVQEYLALYEREGYAPHRRFLGDPVGFFVTEVGTLNQVVHLWRYDSMADREQRRAKLAQAPNWGDYLDAATPFLLRMENRIMVPTAFSPMK